MNGKCLTNIYLIYIEQKSIKKLEDDLHLVHWETVY